MTPAQNSTAPKAPRPLAQNRRQGIRHRLHIPATLVPESEGSTPIPVTVTELSIGGVGFHSKRELKLEAVYHLSSFDTLIPPGMRVNIVSQRELPEGHYEIGAKVLSEVQNHS